MGIKSIDDVLDKIKNPDLRNILSSSKQEHKSIGKELGEQLEKHFDDGKMPNPIATGMSWVKTNAMYLADPTDATVADLMTDGSNMGVKSLSRYINQYKNADEKSTNLAERLVNAELRLTEDLRRFL